MNIHTASLIETIRCQRGQYAGDAIDAARRDAIRELDFVLDAVACGDFERIGRVTDKCRAIFNAAAIEIQRVSQVP